MTDRLTISIKNLYDTFSKYPGNPNMSGSPLYDLDKWNQSLFSKPLQNLTSDDLSLFAGKVITTWGDTDDLKHFLPRLLELTAQLNTPYDVEILYQRLHDANFQTWDTDEQNVVNEFSIALWENLLLDDSEKAEWEFNDYFSAIADFYPNFNELLELWMGNSSFSAIKHLANYVYDKGHYLFTENRISSDEKSARNISSFKNWLVSDSLIQKLTDAFYQYEKTEMAEKLSWVVKILENEKYNTQQEASRLRKDDQ